MALRTRSSAPPVKQLLLANLEAGLTGCISVQVSAGHTLGVYTMLGEILAAHATDDRERLLRMLQNTGAVEDSKINALRKLRPDGSSVTEELFEIVPEEVLQELLTERFRENLFQYLQSDGEPTFEAMETVFVENIQVVHDSRALVEELDALVVSTARLREPPGLVLAPGAGTIKDARHLKLASLCRPHLPIADLLRRAPWEPGRTLALIAELLERGALVAVSHRDADITERPKPQPPAGPKVVVAAGRPDPFAMPRRGPPPKDAVATALANAVSAAVAKVGRQREPTAGVATPPPPPTPTPAAPAAAHPAADTVSAPIARRQPVAEPVSPTAPTAPPAPARVPDPPMKPSPLPSFDADQPTEELSDELAAFQDYDHERVGGEFVTALEHLDRVEIVTLEPERVRLGVKAPPPEPPPEENILVEMEDAENATRSELASAVSLNFAGPKLGDEDARRKVEVMNEVFATMVSALDKVRGPGRGQSRVQLLLEGTPGAFATLFKGVEADPTGRVNTETVMKNLRKRPASEHRRLLNRGVADVIERSLSVASEELDEPGLEAFLEHIAGYQQRLGM
ncbi:hypothetical protein LBMAG42_37840 [Deltaproteobacteria bacterium]|nr:hypothetical protein LBMAG42_37840 [Deltaproteobacteria bacterium]